MKTSIRYLLAGSIIASACLLQGCETLNGMSRDLGSVYSDRSYSSSNHNNLFFWGDSQPRRQQAHSQHNSYRPPQSSGGTQQHSGDSYSIGNYNVNGNQAPAGVVQQPVNSMTSEVGQATQKAVTQTQKAGQATTKSIESLPKGL